ncbi:hypothetical protein [Clostridium tertium]|uniref:hypothetical protein n=1 Tax=Clostridium tertium TaxID=1559 RepID=UPI001AEAEABD|nr:hypothetical protein [Clostridium tertium]MBP1869038.1 hypothetical protein [Clostridium tertium]
MERKRIVINFKNTPEDIKLYEELKKHSSLSGYVKDVLRGLSANKSITDKREANDDISESIEDIMNL